MSVGTFRKVIARLCELGMITPETTLDLHNWGEPFLNPEVADILAHLDSQGLTFRMSTNASCFPTELRSRLFRRLNQIVVSMPGFSQESYDRIHGLRLEVVLRNITRIISTVGNRRVNICMHAYKFNAEEIDVARRYFRSRGVRFTVYHAFFNDYEQAKGYLKDSLPPELRERAGHELILDKVPALLSSKPQGYVCPQRSMLTIDENANCLTCCLVPRNSPDYSLGSLFDMSRQEIQEAKRTRPICSECASLKIDYWVHSAPYVMSEAYYRLPMGRVKTALWRLKSCLGGGLS